MVSTQDRERCAAALNSAWSSQKIRRQRAGRIMGLVAITSLFAGGALATAAQWRIDAIWFDAGFTWRTIVEPLTVFLAAGWLVVIPWQAVALFRKRGDDDDPLWKRLALAGYWVLAGFGMIAVALGFGVRVAPGGATGLLASLAVVIGSLLIVFFMTLSLTATVVRTLAAVDPRDQLVLDIAVMLRFLLDDKQLRSSSFVGSGGDIGWQGNTKERREFAKTIDRAARRVEEGWPRIAGRSQPTARAYLRGFSARIAARLRRHAVDVLMGGIERDRALTDALTDALVSASWGRWEKLADDVPQPAAHRMLRKLGPRLLSAASLVSAAIVIPILFADELGGAAFQVRIALLVAGILMLFDTPKSALDKLVELSKLRP
jgi:hypothetical protein